MRETPGKPETLSAHFLEEQDHARDRLMVHARHSDLIVLGRPAHIDYLPPMLMEDILVGCGRPLLIAPNFLPTTVTGTVVVGWKETPGGFGHSRLRERAFGGVTQSLLEDANIPVFMMH